MIWLVVLTPSFLLFFLMVVIGTAIVFMSSSVVGVWLGLELNFLGVIPLMIGSTITEGEGAMKYFLIQAVGASLLIMGCGIGIGSSWDTVGIVVLVFLVSAVFLKIGIFPLCFWVPSVLGLVSWFNCFVVSVWQKLGLIWFLSGLGLGETMLSFLEIFVVITSIIGGLGGLGVYHYRVLAAYSSLVHVGWMVMISVVSSIGFLFYWSLYFFIMGGFIMWFYYYGVSTFSDFVYLKGSFMDKLSGGVYFFSLAGLPPFSGVFLKVVGIILLLNSFPFVLFFLMLSSALSLFYYSKVFSVLGLSNFIGFNLWLESGLVKLGLVVVSFILNCFLGLGIMLVYSVY
uniref:NADH dehydrogenase subunit 2 n=1 Tax=Euglesa coreana TaxID=658622 RepID=UPI0022378AC1|nr:NADH dehydrogenase subunit 2 [Euglesa coreana]UYR45730.1 NADH dehydrogenase subunit 2 [Euglesa coreana]UYR45743.1 NADH dehydrogenase subunit 2 [Euglesa coreana]